MSRTYNQIVDETTRQYISQLNLNNPPAPAVIEKDLVNEIADEIEQENDLLNKGRKITIPRKLTSHSIALLLNALYHICRIKIDSRIDANKNLYFYQSTGEDEGTYTTDEKELEALIHEYCPTIDKKSTQETINNLVLQVPVYNPCDDPNLIAVNNGIFDYKTKELMPFTPDIVFTTKSKVNYNPNAKNITIHNKEDNTDWDVESWMKELSEDTDVVGLLWEVLGAVVRPLNSWDKAVFLYSTVGCNGKGTLCHLMRNLCGENNSTSISLKEFGGEFLPSSIMSALAIITDENPTNTYTDKLDIFKAVVTNDVFSLNRKYKDRISYKFRGIVVECVNDLPKSNDKSDSFYRRQLFIPFEKSFLGQERKYIKDDYLNRTEVLEYVLHKVLHMNYYEFSEPQACKDLHEEYKEFNDPVRQFVNEIFPQLAWDLLPNQFVYDLFKAWHKRNIPSGTVSGKNTFLADVRNILRNDDTWEAKKDTAYPTADLMDDPEPLIEEYGLKEWMNPNYMGHDTDKLCMPQKASSYHGFRRR